MIRTLLGFCVASLLLMASASAKDARWTMLVDVAGRQVEGAPLAWSKEHILMLARDGRLYDLPVQTAKNYRKTSSYFSPYSAAEIRAELERELKGRLEVTGTGHYLVAHPPGKSSYWSGRFEDLYRSCLHYFNLRDFRVHEPEFPLVAIVWPKRDEFVRFAAGDGTSVGGNILGFYSPKTNRIMLYDQQGGSKGGRAWQQNEATIIHEATHQMAFNMGVHNRFAPTPKWIAEGLGTMFEARGVWDWRNYPTLSDRINRERLAQFKQWQANGRKAGAFVNLLSSDRVFDSNPAAAYSESWAWVLFLTETFPQKFGQYVQKTANLPDFLEYPSARRLADFTAVFGDDLRMLETHFLRFMAALK